MLACALHVFPLHYEALDTIVRAMRLGVGAATKNILATQILYLVSTFGYLNFFLISHTKFGYCNLGNFRCYSIFAKEANYMYPKFSV